MNKAAYPTRKTFILFIIFILLALIFLLFNVKNVSHAEFQPPGQKILKNIIKRKFSRLCNLPQKKSASCHASYVTNDSANPLVSNTPIPGSLGPNEFHLGYNLPCSPGGPTQTICNQPDPGGFSNQTIAIITAFHAPTIENDIQVYSQYFGLPSCTRSNGCLKIVNQNGGTYLPRRINESWSLETTLDVEIAHSICQTCKILIVEANSNSILDLGIAVDTAAALDATAISNSYGTTEWSNQTFFDRFYNHPGIAVTASSGDSGYGASFPASSPFVVAVGGTTLNLLTDNSYANETVWNGTGSGCSAFEPANPWQKNISTPCGENRATVDVAAVADPNTGAAVYSSTPYLGYTGWWQIGGTSLSSPIIAASYALAGGVDAGTNASSRLYNNSSPANLHDITSGSNGNCSTIMCNAEIGYDGPTGLGTPNGISVFASLLITPTTPTPTATASPTPSPTPTSIPSPTPTTPTTPTPTPTPTPQPSSGPTPTPLDTTRPTVSIIYPSNRGIVPQNTNITVTANADDNIGINKIIFYRNTNPVCEINNTSNDKTYSCEMYTENAERRVIYRVRVYDLSGNLATDRVRVRAL